MEKEFHDVINMNFEDWLKECEKRGFKINPLSTMRQKSEVKKSD